MSPKNFHNDQHTKLITIANNNNNNNYVSLRPPSLKVNKESKVIKHSSPPPSFSLPSSSSSSLSSLSSVGAAKPPTPHRQRPVIIYTHSPKIIHTHPKDFIALVQKLTGMSRSEDDGPPQPTKQEKANAKEEQNKSDDTDSSTVTTEENCGSNNHIIGDGQVNSCFVPPIFEAPNPYMSNIPVFGTNSGDFLCTTNPQPFYGYTESLFFGTPNMRSSIPSSSTLEGINDFCEF